MRKIQFIFMCITALFVSACSDSTDNTVTQDPTAPVLNAVDDIVITDENKEETVSFSWEKADYGYSAAITYSLYAATNGKTTPVLGTTSATALDIKLSDLNGQIVNCGVIPGAVVDVEFTVVASIGSDATKNVTSAPITVKVTTLAGMSEALHLCGDMFDDASGFGTNNYWNINNYQYVMFRDDNMSLDFYISNFPEGAELKFIPNSTLGDWTKPSYGKDGSNDGVLKGKDAGNIKLTGLTGYTKITADLLNLTYTIEPYDASGATVHPKMCISGDFNGWTNQEMTQSHYDPHIWFIDGVVLEDVGKGVKFHTGDWTTNWGTVDFPYGKGVQNGANIEVTETGTYFVKICDLTGNYVFYKTN